MAIFNEYQEKFYLGKRNKTVKFCVNDAVEITTGENKGARCAVISLQKIEPDVIYLVERGDNGESVIVNQSQIKLL